MEELQDKFPPTGEAPWAVFEHDPPNKEVQTFSAISPSFSVKRSYVASIPQLCDKAIVASYHGWLVLRETDDADQEIYSLWNPVTLNTIRLPPLVDIPDGEISNCILTTGPESDYSKTNAKACVLILFFSRIGLISSCRLCQQNSSWVTQRVGIDGTAVRINKSVAALDGVVYGLAGADVDNLQKQFNLYSIEVADKDDSHSLIFRSLEIRFPQFLWDLLNTSFETYLVESSKSIYCVTIYIRSDKLISGMKVYKLDLQENQFFKVDSLQGRTFFLDEYSSTWCWGSTTSEARGGVQGDCVYFHRKEGDETNLYCYSLHDQSLMELPLHPDLISPRSFSIWFKPQHERFLEEKESDVLNRNVNAQFEEQPQLKETEESRLCEFPFHIVELISAYMHTFDYWNFRLSGKFESKVLPARKTISLFPLLMFLKNDGGLCDVMDPCRVDSVALQLSLHPFSIEFSKKGWLITRTTSKSLHFLNPFTKKRKDLPLLGRINWCTSFGFSTIPTCSSCWIVGIVPLVDKVFVQHLRFGDEEWNYDYLDHGDITFQLVRTSPLYCEEAFYFVDVSGNLGELRLVGESPSWQAYSSPRIVEGPRDNFEWHLVECGGELYTIYIDDRGKLLKIFKFKFNRPRDNWVEIHDIKNHVFFISSPSSFSRVAKDSTMSNRIYLPRLKGNKIVFYSLQTGKYHALNPEDSFEDLYNTKELLMCCWI